MYHGELLKGVEILHTCCPMRIKFDYIKKQLFPDVSSPLKHLESKIVKQHNVIYGFLLHVSTHEYYGDNFISNPNPNPRYKVSIISLQYYAINGTWKRISPARS